MLEVALFFIIMIVVTIALWIVGRVLWHRPA
jgi:hypothetical protein